MFNWIFRNRETGKITISQVPNLPLAVFLVTTGLRWALRPSGSAATAVNAVAAGALVLWALDEVVRGVNPWRRALGAATLSWQLFRLVAR